MAFVAAGIMVLAGIMAMGIAYHDQIGAAWKAIAGPAPTTPATP